MNKIINSSLIATILILLALKCFTTYKIKNSKLIDETKQLDVVSQKINLSNYSLKVKTNNASSELDALTAINYAYKKLLND